MLFRTQIIFCSSELRLHFRITEVGSLLSLNRAWRAQVTRNLDFSCFKSLYYVPFTLVVLVCCSLPLSTPLVSRYLLSILLLEL